MKTGHLTVLIADLAELPVAGQTDKAFFLQLFQIDGPQTAVKGVGGHRKQNLFLEGYGIFGCFRSIAFLGQRINRQITDLSQFILPDGQSDF